MIKRGETVILKPNAGHAEGPDTAVCTSPETLRAVIREVKKAQPSRIIVAESAFYTIRLHFFYYLSVYLQSYFCTIRKYLYLCHWFYAVHATATGNINHRFRIPVCFIKIKCIFRWKSVRICSSMLLVWPYGLVIWPFGQSSVIGIVSGLPYTVAEELNTRSEERRVGKECRSRWSPYH